MNSALENLEAAKLASMVGSQLKAVDQLTTDRSNLPANRININEFVASVTNPNYQIQNKFDNVPYGYAKPPPEHIIQQMVPDVKPSIPQPEHRPEPSNQTTHSEKQQIVNQIQNNEPNTESTIKNRLDGDSKNISFGNNDLTKDIKKISKSLEGINKSFSEMVSLFKIQVEKDGRY